VLIEEYAQKLKDCADEGKFGKVSDDAFRIQLAARKGDIDQAAALFARFGPEWAELNRTGTPAGASPTGMKK